MNKILEEDLLRVSQCHVNFGNFYGKTFLVTGATGLIGSLFIKNLLYCNKKYDLNVHIIALVRNYNKFKNVFYDIDQIQEIEIIDSDIVFPFKIHGQVDYILHAASVTTSKVMVTNPIKTIQTAIYGTDHILEIATQKKAKIIYLSSMEVYGQVFYSCENVTENNLGYLDLTNVRTDYAESKRLCESLCTAYYSQNKLDVIIIRLAQTFGAGILHGENRVFAQFARSVINGENIVLHTKGASEGNYCYTSDAVIALLILFEKGKSGNTYNVCNENCHTTIAEMANMVASNFSNGKSKVVFDIPDSDEDYGYAANVKLRLNSEKMRALGWMPEIGLKESYQRMIDYLKTMLST